MNHCTSCGAELPVAAQFCGNCGRIASVVQQTPDGMRAYPSGDMHADNTPTSISGASRPVLSSGEHEYSTIRHTWSKGEIAQNMPVADEEDEEEEGQRRRALLGLPLLGALANGQPPANGLPMVQGTPYLNGVPLVQGTPGGAAAAQAIHGAASSVPSPFAPSTPPPNTPLPHPGPWPPVHTPTPPPGPSSLPAHAGTGSGSSPRPGTSGGSCALTALIIVVVCLVIIGTIGGLFFGVSPAL